MHDTIAKYVVNRREFLVVSTAATLAWGAYGQRAMASPLNRADFESLIPVDKNLSPAWVKSLFDRGTPQVYRGAELTYIGMPVGGICAGQLYLGGDGKLWLWDIFNQNLRTREYHYAEPPVPTSPIEQGFSLTVNGQIRALDREGFPDVTFRGEYPIGLVEYVADDCPVATTMEVFSPFIPLNADDSGLPVTIFNFTLRNTSEQSVDVTLTGELENGVCLANRARDGLLHSRTLRKPGSTTLLFSAEDTAANRTDAKSLHDLPDYGTMAIALIGAPADEAGPDATAPFGKQIIGSLARKATIAPGETAQVTFLIAWHFKNLSMLEVLTDLDRYYATKFDSAETVVDYVAENFDRLTAETRLWRDTWYDSTLPYWFLDRTMLNTSTLATTTSHRMENGRYYGWEGVGCCPGTCTHVYQYAHATARLFPELERDTRERVDFGLAQKADGVIHFRGEWQTDIHYSAVDGQAGTILRALREHQMSASDDFLQRNWPRIKLATQWLIAKDGNGDGIIEDAQHNTLDTDWYGAVAWLSGMYLAALRAAAQMADEVGDATFGRQCRAIADQGKNNLVARLFDGEYFINELDPHHPESINSKTGCEIDQVLGQSWAWQVGLPRVLPAAKTHSALQSLWKYNFAPDVGPYRKKYPEGRWYAMPGESGMFLCTFPRQDWDYTDAKGQGPEGYAGYLNECMNGFEYQVAGHMLWEGMVMQGLAVTRAVHDRYHAAKRNPWNEVESGDHYTRSMASYGVFLAACGFECHGPKRHLGFAPRMSPNDFRSAFTCAEGWGSYSQRTNSAGLHAEITNRWGKVRLKTLSLELNTKAHLPQVTAIVGDREISATLEVDRNRALVTFADKVELSPHQTLRISIATG